MALIKCPECGTEISDQAISCPRCGRVINNTTIQLTNKRWKVVKLVAWIMIVVGGYMLLSGSSNGGFQNPTTGLGFTLVFIGVIVLFVGKLGTWWTNK